ncbi:hypothetical protein HY993_03375, partial [Candidatus Micrarchaeota archaeon]|nr:hypothetical protein [Candidatus Micrarchaeota archaeon]
MIHVGIKDAFLNAYFQVEDKYYSLMDYLDSQVKIPVYKYFVTPIESRGVPSFPIAVAACLILLGLIASLFSFGASTGGSSSFQVGVYSQDSPLSGADVEVYLGDKLIASGTTAGGKALFEGLPQSALVAVLAKKSGYQPASLDGVDLAEKESARIELNCLLESCKSAAFFNKLPVTIVPPKARPGTPIWPNDPNSPNDSIGDFCAGNEVNCDELTNITDIVPGHYPFSIDVRDSQTRELIAAPVAIAVLDAITGEKLLNTTSTSGLAYFTSLKEGLQVYFTASANGYFPYSGLAEGETFEVAGELQATILIEKITSDNSVTSAITVLDENNAETSAFVELYQDNQFEQGAQVNGRQSFSLKKGAQYFALATKGGYEAAGASFKSGENPSIKLTKSINGGLGGQCTLDSDCPDEQECRESGASSACVAPTPVPTNSRCYSDGDCGSGEICKDSGACEVNPRKCVGDFQCPVGQICDNFNGVCAITPAVTPIPDGNCVEDGTCLTGQVCNQASAASALGACEEKIIKPCLYDAQCLNGQYCQNFVGQCGNLPTPLPDEPGKCVVDSQCAITQVCSQFSASPLGSCIGPTPDPGGCLADNECPDGLICKDNGLCEITPVCSNDADCPADFLCDSRQNACVANPAPENSLVVKTRWYHDYSGGQAFYLDSTKVSLLLSYPGQNISCANIQETDSSGQTAFTKCITQAGAEIPLSVGRNYFLAASASRENTFGSESFPYYTKSAVGGTVAAGAFGKELVLGPGEILVNLSAVSLFTQQPVPGFTAYAACKDLLTDQISQTGACTADEFGSCLIRVETYSACSFAATHADYLPKLLVLDKAYHAADNNSLEQISLIPRIDSDDKNIYKSRIVLDFVRSTKPSRRPLSQGEKLVLGLPYEAVYSLVTQNKSSKIGVSLTASNSITSNLQYSWDSPSPIPPVYNGNSLSGFDEFAGSSSPSGFCEQNPAPLYLPLADGDEPVLVRSLWLNFTNSQRSSESFAGSLTQAFAPTEFDSAKPFVNLSRRAFTYQAGASPEFYLNPADENVFAEPPKNLCEAKLDSAQYTVIDSGLTCENGVCLTVSYSQQGDSRSGDGFSVDLDKKTFFIDVKVENFDYQTGLAENLAKTNPLSFNFTYEKALLNVTGITLTYPRTVFGYNPYSIPVPYSAIQSAYSNENGLYLDLLKPIPSNVYKEANYLTVTLAVDALADSPNAALLYNASYSSKLVSKNGFIQINALDRPATHCNFFGCSTISFSQPDQGGLREWTNASVKDASLNDYSPSDYGFAFQPLQASFSMRVFEPAPSAELSVVLPDNLELYPSTGFEWEVLDANNKLVNSGFAAGLSEKIAVGGLKLNYRVTGTLSANTTKEGIGDFLVDLSGKTQSGEDFSIAGQSMVSVKKRYGRINFTAFDQTGAALQILLNNTLLNATAHSANFLCTTPCALRTLLHDADSLDDYYQNAFDYGLPAGEPIGAANFTGTTRFKKTVKSIYASDLPSVTEPTAVKDVSLLVIDLDKQLGEESQDEALAGQASVIFVEKLFDETAQKTVCQTKQGCAGLISSPTAFVYAGHSYEMDLGGIFNNSVEAQVLGYSVSVGSQASSAFINTTKTAPGADFNSAAKPVLARLLHGSSFNELGSLDIRLDADQPISSYSDEEIPEQVTWIQEEFNITSDLMAEPGLIGFTKKVYFAAAGEFENPVFSNLNISLRSHVIALTQGNPVAKYLRNPFDSRLGFGQYFDDSEDPGVESPTIIDEWQANSTNYLLSFAREGSSCNEFGCITVELSQDGNDYGQSLWRNPVDESVWNYAGEQFGFNSQSAPDFISDSKKEFDDWNWFYSDVQDSVLPLKARVIIDFATLDFADAQSTWSGPLSLYPSSNNLVGLQESGKFLLTANSLCGVPLSQDSLIDPSTAVAGADGISFVKADLGDCKMSGSAVFDATFSSLPNSPSQVPTSLVFELKSGSKPLMAARKSLAVRSTQLGRGDVKLNSPVVMQAIREDSSGKMVDRRLSSSGGDLRAFQAVTEEDCESNPLDPQAVNTQSFSSIALKPLEYLAKNDLPVNGKCSKGPVKIVFPMLVNNDLPMEKFGEFSLWPDGASKEFFAPCVDLDQVTADGMVSENAQFTSRGELYTMSKLFHHGSGFGFASEWADYNRDGDVTGADAKFVLRDFNGLCTTRLGLIEATALNTVANRFGNTLLFNQPYSRSEYCYDFNSNGAVDVGDVALVESNLGKTVSELLATDPLYGVFGGPAITRNAVDSVRISVGEKCDRQYSIDNNFVSLTTQPVSLKAGRYQLVAYVVPRPALANPDPEPSNAPQSFGAPYPTVSELLRYSFTTVDKSTNARKEELYGFLDLPLNASYRPKITQSFLESCNSPVVSVAFSTLFPDSARSTCNKIPLKVDPLVPFDGFKLNVTCEAGEPFIANQFTSEGNCVQVKETNEAGVFDVTVNYANEFCKKVSGNTLTFGQNKPFEMISLPIKCGAFGGETEYSLKLNVSKRELAPLTLPSGVQSTQNQGLWVGQIASNADEIINPGQGFSYTAYYRISKKIKKDKEWSSTYSYSSPSSTSLKPKLFAVVNNMQLAGGAKRVVTVRNSVGASLAFEFTQSGPKAYLFALNALSGTKVFEKDSFGADVDVTSQVFSTAPPASSPADVNAILADLENSLKTRAFYKHNNLFQYCGQKTGGALECKNSIEEWKSYDVAYAQQSSLPCEFTSNLCEEGIGGNTALVPLGELFYNGSKPTYSYFDDASGKQAYGYKCTSQVSAFDSTLFNGAGGCRTSCSNPASLAENPGEYSDTNSFVSACSVDENYGPVQAFKSKPTYSFNGWLNKTQLAEKPVAQGYPAALFKTELGQPIAPSLGFVAKLVVPDLASVFGADANVNLISDACRDPNGLFGYFIANKKVSIGPDNSLSPQTSLGPLALFGDGAFNSDVDYKLSGAVACKALYSKPVYACGRLYATVDLNDNSRCITSLDAFPQPDYSISRVYASTHSSYGGSSNKPLLLGSNYYVAQGTPLSVFNPDGSSASTQGISVTGCELSVDDGAPIQMEASDGSFDSYLENATGTIGPLSAGLHDLSFKCRGATGQVSSPATITVNVTQPQVTLKAIDQNYRYSWFWFDPINPKSDETITVVVTGSQATLSAGCTGSDNTLLNYNGN